MKPTKVILTSAAAVGVALGSFGLASAFTSSPSEPTTPAVQTDDEVDDGIDYEFEGEEVGENGDGIPGPDEATEQAEEADETDEADGVEEADDEADDGIDHQNESEGDNDNEHED